MVLDIDICEVTVAAVFVLASHIVAHYVAVFHLSLVEDFGVYVKESPIFKRKVRHWITTMSDTSFEVPSPSVLLIEPNSELSVSHTRTSIVVKISDLVFVGKQMSCNVSGYSSS